MILMSALFRMRLLGDRRAHSRSVAVERRQSETAQAEAEERVRQDDAHRVFVSTRARLDEVVEIAKQRLNAKHG